MYWFLNNMQEIKFEPLVMCEAIDLHDTFSHAQIGTGDIICYQKSSKPVNIYRYPYVQSFLNHVHDQKEAHRKIQTLEEEVVVLKCQARHEKEEASMECVQLKHERNNAVRQVGELCDQNRQVILEFSVEDLEQATDHFSNACKVGETEYGRVYKGIIHKTMVAIKLSCSDNLFQREVSILREGRHPNIVTIVGVCSEASALVYEWLPNGNLEDRIICKNNSPPLLWRRRAQVIGEVCCMLLFLHSRKPNALVHGDLRPCNIFIDASHRSKLCHFGMSDLFLEPGTCPPNLTARLPYMDPEFLTTGELTQLSDVYSLGIIILHLLTGMPPLSIAKKVATALERDSLHLLIYKSAGDWPYMQAKQLALIGLSCVEMTREKRPDLLTKVWAIIEPMVTKPPVASWPYFQLAYEGSCAPAHFFCPILKCGELSSGLSVARLWIGESMTMHVWLEDDSAMAEVSGLLLMLAAGCVSFGVEQRRVRRRLHWLLLVASSPRVWWCSVVWSVVRFGLVSLNMRHLLLI
ncbi:unnamed protein product [Urochloa decumbens]|uniref:RING-type E3 ubiquitin transferase n=1 Tax=Urochloa decumbens TaxID=240449 RepID=A0ABC9H3D8_9POAL